MTHFRFRNKCVGYMRWRCRAARRRTTLLALPITSTARPVAGAAAWRRRVPLPAPAPLREIVLQVGAFVVSEAGDPQLCGHPDILY